MRWTECLQFLCVAVACLSIFLAKADDPYRYYTWTVTCGTHCSSCRPLSGYPHQWPVSYFPGHRLDVVTNDDILNLINNLDEPFLLTWGELLRNRDQTQTRDQTHKEEAILSIMNWIRTTGDGAGWNDGWRPSHGRAGLWNIAHMDLYKTRCSKTCDDFSGICTKSNQPSSVKIGKNKSEPRV